MLLAKRCAGGAAEVAPAHLAFKHRQAADGAGPESRAIDVATATAWASGAWLVTLGQQWGDLRGEEGRQSPILFGIGPDGR
ncbi:hypothetical protein BMMON2_01470 [Burkholderia mallei]